MKTLVQHIKEDFKISRNTKFNKNFFDNMFYGIDTSKFNILTFELNTTNTEKHEKHVTSLLKKLYSHKHDENFYMKKFFLDTIEQYYRADNSEPNYTYINNAKSSNDWNYIKQSCVPIGWWYFIDWLFEQKNKHVNEDFKISKNTQLITFNHVFPDVDIHKWDWKSYMSDDERQKKYRERVNVFAYKLYNSVDYICEFYSMTIKQFYENGGVSKEKIENYYKENIKKLKKYGWAQFEYACLEQGWWAFAYWLIEQHN